MSDRAQLNRLLGVLGVDPEGCPTDAPVKTMLGHAIDAALKQQETLHTIKRALREWEQ